MSGNHERTFLIGNQCKPFLSLLIMCVCFSESVWGSSEDRKLQADGPWFTGTLLSTRGSTVDQGHAVAEPYFYFTQYGGLYNDNWRLQSATVSRTIIQQTYLIYGVTSRIDVEIAPQWLENSSILRRVRRLSASTRLSSPERSLRFVVTRCPNLGARDISDRALQPSRSVQNGSGRDRRRVFCDDARHRSTDTDMARRGPCF
jgi:hypothetical protein